MDRQQLRWTKASKFLLIVALVIPFAGCAGFLSNMMYMMHGLKVDAVYDGFVDSRVAIVVVSDASAYGPDTLTLVVGRAMAMRLTQNVKNISIIPQNVIENWKDTHGWDEVDFRAIGKGVGADRVLAIDVSSYSIREGATLYKGRSMLTTTIYDIQEEGKVVFSEGPAEFVFPRSHARPALSTSEQQFEAMYLAKLVDKIARNFYAHDKAEPVAEDATGLEFR